MKKIKVLHVGLSSNIGGMEKVVESWGKYLPEDMIFDFVSVEKIPLAFEEDWIAKGSTIHRILPRKKYPLKSTKQLEQIIKNGNYDYVHYHAMSLSWAEPILLADKYHVNRIIHSHLAFGKSSLLSNRILHTIGKWRLKNTNYYKLACGDEAGKGMFDAIDFLVIENAVDVKDMSFSEKGRLEIRERYGLKDTEYLIGHVGRATPQKNYPFILSTFHELLKIRKDVKLMLVGNVDKDNEIQEMIKNYHIEEFVICPGMIPEMKNYYSAMDLFFFPSLFEGLSVALVEAQAMNLPCIVSCNVAKESAITDLVEFTKIDDSKEVAQKISQRLKVTWNREKVRIPNDYRLENSTKKIFDFYRNHLND